MTTASDLSAIYQQLLGHAPDTAGLQYWLNEVNNGRSVSDVSSNISGIINSALANGTVTNSNDQRALDPGMPQLPVATGAAPVNQGFPTQMLAPSLMGSTPAPAIATSNDQRALDPGMPQLPVATAPLPVNQGFPTQMHAPSLMDSASTDSNSATASALSAVYQKLLGHAPDAAGLQYWLNQVNSGRSVSDVSNNISSIINSSLAKGATAPTTAQGAATPPAQGTAPAATASLANMSPATTTAAVNASGGPTSYQQLMDIVHASPQYQQLLQVHNSGQESDLSPFYTVNVPGLGAVMGNINNNDSQALTVVSGNYNDGTFQRAITPGANGGLNISDAQAISARDSGMTKYGPALIAAMLTAGAAGVGAGAGAAGAAEGAGAAGAAEGAGAAGASAAGGGLDSFLAGDGALSYTGAGVGAGMDGVVAGMGGAEYANETAKLLQQQALAQSGMDLLPTTLPTIDLSAPMLPETPLLPPTPPGGSPLVPPIIPPGGGPGSGVLNGLTGTQAAAAAAQAGGGLLNALNSPLGAALAGAALSGLSGGNQPAGNTTTTNSPWGPQQPYLQDLYSKAQSTYNANSAPSAAETSALQAIQQRAATGNPLNQSAQSSISGLLGQDPSQAYGIGQANQYMGQTTNVGTNPLMGVNNPYLNQQIQTAQDDITRQMQPQFDSAQRTSGSFGNSGLQETYARELPKQLGIVDSNMRMQDYGQQQQLQENALNRSVQAQQADLTRNSGLAQQGIQNNLSQYNNMLGLQTQSAFNTPGLTATDYTDPQMAYNTARSAREANFLPLQQYQSALSGNPGSTTTSPYFTNPTAGLLGGAMAGLGVYNAANKAQTAGQSGGLLSSIFG